jgi:magnesium-transporting ATPase (P-type)
MEYTFEGYRVIALSYKDLDASEDEALELERNEAESELVFLGFLIM